jgi:Ca2+-binding EF-hand superfamily protein
MFDHDGSGTLDRDELFKLFRYKTKNLIDRKNKDLNRANQTSQKLTLMFMLLFKSLL